MYEFEFSMSVSEVDIIIINCNGLTCEISESLEKAESVEEGFVYSPWSLVMSL